jgi:hypothetical protein
MMNMFPERTCRSVTHDTLYTELPKIIFIGEIVIVKRSGRTAAIQILRSVITAIKCELLAGRLLACYNGFPLPAGGRAVKRRSSKE